MRRAADVDKYTPGSGRVRVVYLPLVSLRRDPGPRGGHTVAGEVQQSHNHEPGSSTVTADEAPQYRMKAQTKQVREIRGKVRRER